MRGGKLVHRGLPGAEGFMAFQPGEPLARRSQFERRGEARPEQSGLQKIERKAAESTDNLPAQKVQAPTD
jgi:hypothetical protein